MPEDIAPVKFISITQTFDPKLLIAADHPNRSMKLINLERKSCQTLFQSQRQNSHAICVKHLKNYIRNNKKVIVFCEWIKEAEREPLLILTLFELHENSVKEIGNHLFPETSPKRLWAELDELPNGNLLLSADQWRIIYELKIVDNPISINVVKIHNLPMQFRSISHVERKNSSSNPFLAIALYDKYLLLGSYKDKENEINFIKKIVLDYTPRRMLYFEETSEFLIYASDKAEIMRVKFNSLESSDLPYIDEVKMDMKDFEFLQCWTLFQSSDIHDNSKTNIAIYSSDGLHTFAYI